MSLKIEIDIADARLEMAAKKPLAAKRLLEASLRQARKIGLLELEYEARLAKGELERKFSNPVAGNAILAELQKDAIRKEYKFIARKAAMAASQN